MIARKGWSPRVTDWAAGPWAHQGRCHRWDTRRTAMKAVIRPDILFIMHII